MNSLFRCCWLLRSGCLLTHLIIKFPPTEFQNLQVDRKRPGEMNIIMNKVVIVTEVLEVSGGINL